MPIEKKGQKYFEEQLKPRGEPMRWPAFGYTCRFPWEDDYLEFDDSQEEEPDADR